MLNDELGNYSVGVLILVNIFAGLLDNKATLLLLSSGIFKAKFLSV